MATHHVPAGHNAVSPYLLAKDANAVIALLREAFGAEELSRHARPDGLIMHAELRIADSVLMIADATDDMPAMPCMVHVYVPDCDAAYERALACGATSVREPSSQFYGDRSAGVRDASGNQWWIATHQEDVPEAEMERRARDAGR
jgi:PhnB protein